MEAILPISGRPAGRLEQDFAQGSPSGRLIAALTGFSQTLIRRLEVAESLEDLAHQLVAALELAGAGISLLRGTHLEHVAADRDRALRPERAQERSGHGPGVEAARSNEVIALSDLNESRHRWPAFAEEADAVGMRAVAAVPLHTEGGTVGAIDLYCDQPHEWTTTELGSAQVLADLASAYVVSADQIAAHRSTVVQLQRALDSRIIVEQAKGVLANAYEMSPEQAFQLVRSHARAHRATLKEVADAVVNLGLRP